MGDDYFKLFKGLTNRMIASHQSIFINLEKLVNRRLVYQPKICQLHCWPKSCFTSHHMLPEIIAGVQEFLDALPSLKTMFKIIIDVFKILLPTRSYAALRAADLDWIIGPGYSSGGYILGENHEKPTWNHEKPGITSYDKHAASTDLWNEKVLIFRD